MLQQNRGSDERRKEMEAREKRRLNMLERQEQEYQDYLKNIHKKRYEKQQVIYLPHMSMIDNMLQLLVV